MGYSFFQLLQDGQDVDKVLAEKGREDGRPVGIPFKEKLLEKKSPFDVFVFILSLSPTLKSEIVLFTDKLGRLVSYTCTAYAC